MSNMKTLTLEASKLLHDKGIEVDTMMYYHSGRHVTSWEMRGRTVSANNLPIPSPSLDEVLDVLPAIDTKLESEIDAHKILDTYLTGGMEAVSEYIISLFE